MLKNLFAAVLVFFTSLLPLLAQIEHVEPMNWWVGMKDSHLQLLVHGERIGETVPSINYPGVVLKKVQKADSKNYLFLDLVITKTAKPGRISIAFKKDGKLFATYLYPLLSRAFDPTKLKGFNSTDAIYLLVPDRFANGEYANDVLPDMKENIINRSYESGRHGGDIRGIINHLDYVANMGFTAIWPTPMLENNMGEYSYHGYSITNHYKVDPRYGSMEEYKELASKARQKGLKLIFDEVLNHTGINYWWMKDLPFKNWINYPDSAVMTTHQRTTNQDPNSSKYDAQLMSKGWFDKMMPDMNGQNPFMANYLIQCSIWWIETLQLGGIRQDTYGYSNKALLTDWSCRIMDEYPEFNMVGEEWSGNPLVASYWQRGMKNNDGYKSCLKSVMDFPVQSALVQALLSEDAKDPNKGLGKLYEAMANDFIYANPKNLLVFGDNHDMDRIFTQMNKKAELNKMALTFLATVRGIPQMLYGTEILMENSAKKGNHGLIRSDFPGGWKEDTTNGFTGAGLSTEQFAFQEYVRKLLNWRKKTPVIAQGKTLHFAPFNGLYVYFRYDDKKTIMVVMNKNASEIQMDLKRFAEILTGKTKAKNAMTGSEYPLPKTLPVSGYSTEIFEVE